MKTIFYFEMRYFRRPSGYLILFLLLVAGFFAGAKFTLSLGDGVFLNGAYTAGFLIGFLSLSLIFIATILAGQLLFQEKDARFDLIVFSTPFRENHFVLGKFLSFFTQTLMCFLSMVTGFTVGQILRTGSQMNPEFHIIYYFYPFIVLGVVNCLIICSVLLFVSTVTRDKMALTIGGLFLYVLYMVLLIYSGSPFMTGTLPQSATAQQISAYTDPFGLSAYFFQAKDFTVAERNHSIVPLSGVFSINRTIIIFISFLLIAISTKSFSFHADNKWFRKDKKNRINKKADYNFVASNSPSVYQSYHRAIEIQSIISFIKVDLIYTFKRTVFYAICLLLLFYIGMEIYAEINQGIRFPQHYASSGLIAQTINKNFYSLGVFMSVYLINDLYWRSSSSNFSLLEEAGYFSFVKKVSHWLSISVLLTTITLLLVLQGIIFQWVFDYPHFDGAAYLGVLVFSTCPLIILSGFHVLLNATIRQKYVALAASVLFAGIFATPLSKMFIKFSLLRFLSGYTGMYSEFWKYGIYLQSFVYRILFGLGVLLGLWLILDSLKRKKFDLHKIIFAILTVVLVFFGAISFQKGYLPNDEKSQILKSVIYEKKYRQFQNLPQPTVISVKTQIDLYPSKNAYTIRGTYSLQNLTGQPIKRILFDINENTQIEKVIFKFCDQISELKNKVEVVALATPLMPGDKAKLAFSLRYQWYPVNGHDPMNAIIENGSFMRISQYFPAIGYQSDYEISAIQRDRRIEFGLGGATEIKKLETPNTHPHDFIKLDMTISTTVGQTAIGTGELTRNWKQNGRHYFQYRAENIPFRFAIASAEYKVKKAIHSNIPISVYFHPAHFENVGQLIDDAKLSLDYCVKNYGMYPFKSVSFVEISSFTTGFNATTYPSVIFMTENMAFHANIKNHKQHVINELAAHELSHFWWGNNQISPDDREGAAMLTETLAMYTEMMICRAKYGEETMKKRLEIHEQIYQSENGFSQPQPLYKVIAKNTHISYSKGAIVMVRLSEVIGEKRLNSILKDFLRKYKYPYRATTLDFLTELKNNLDSEEYKRVIGLFSDI